MGWDSGMVMMRGRGIARERKSGKEKWSKAVFSQASKEESDPPTARLPGTHKTLSITHLMTTTHTFPQPCHPMPPRRATCTTAHTSMT